MNIYFHHNSLSSQKNKELEKLAFTIKHWQLKKRQLNGICPIIVSWRTALNTSSPGEAVSLPGLRPDSNPAISYIIFH